MSGSVYVFMIPKYRAHKLVRIWCEIILTIRLAQQNLQIETFLNGT